MGCSLGRMGCSLGRRGCSSQSAGFGDRACYQKHKYHRDEALRNANGKERPWFAKTKQKQRQEGGGAKGMGSPPMPGARCSGR